MSKTFVTISTKGGVGKSIISFMILPALFVGDNKKISIYEMDNSNDTKEVLQNTSLNIESLKADGSKDKIVDLLLESMAGDDDVINIIDVGGGDDTLSILKNLKKAMIENITYLIPINKDIDHTENMMKTVEEIRAFDPSSKIFLMMNRCESLTEEQLKKDFRHFFKKVAENKKILKGVVPLFILDAPLLAELKSDFGTTLYDFYPKAIEMKEKFFDLRKEWYKKTAELEDDGAYFRKKMDEIDFADDVIDFVKTLKPLAVLKG